MTRRIDRRRALGALGTEGPFYFDAALLLDVSEDDGDGYAGRISFDVAAA